jgi:GNAT superfamily N-acetyltransferase
MIVRATKTKLKTIQPLRELFLQEANHQVRYNATHERGWSDSYLLTLDAAEVGYGSLKAGDNAGARDIVFELFVVPPFRRHAGALFRELLAASGARSVECQSNDVLLSSLLFEHVPSVSANVFLFEDDAVTQLAVPGAVVRPRQKGDRVFEHKCEPVGDYVAVEGGEVVGTAGYLTHYNPPFADLYMEVRDDRRRRGLGSLLLQEVKKACYLAGRIPAARCDLSNAASRATLTKAGMRVCGFMLAGKVAG